MGDVMIVGAGQAGVQAALSLRDHGFRGKITLIGEEEGHPYQRPPLSKAYLLGKVDDGSIALKGPDIYGDYAIDLITGVRVTAIDREARRVDLSSGQSVAYGHLILATGARQRRLEVAGADLAGVLTLRTLPDAKRLMAAMGGARRAVVVGGGFIGLEFAAVARAKGLDVTVVELAPRPMGRALSAAMSQFFVERHAAWGVKFLFGAAVKAFRGSSGLSGVELSDGTVLPADIALIGIGVAPNDDLARAAGLDVADGVLVDALLRASDPTISAIGDCARHPNPFSLTGPVRVESVQNATDQGRCVALRLTGQVEAYSAIPWFWSDQGDLKLQIAGLGAGHDTEVVRGDPATGAFSVLCFKDGRLVAVESVNRGPDHVIGRRLIAGGVSPTLEQAADETLALKTHLTR